MAGIKKFTIVEDLTTITFKKLLSKADCSPDIISLQELLKFPSFAKFTLPG
jgi:hypothetical protein